MKIEEQTTNIEKIVCFLRYIALSVVVLLQFLFKLFRFPILLSFSHSAFVLAFWSRSRILVSFSHSGLVLSFWIRSPVDISSSTIVLLLLRSFSIIGNVSGNEVKNWSRRHSYNFRPFQSEPEKEHCRIRTRDEDLVLQDFESIQNAKTWGKYSF